ncbi:DUF292-domain-containing protein, partial [Rhizopogon vinicolor AM-OR11-026]
RLSVQRLRIAQQKKEAQAKSSRRDIALLLEKGKTESARVKVEAIINEDITLELYELLELYCELLIARFGLLDQNTRDPDPGISEGVCSIIHAAPRIEVKELHILRDMLMHKYGRDFSAAVMENRSGCVSERVIRKLVIETPSDQLVDGYLGEIAKAYSVKWAPASLTTTAAEESAVVRRFSLKSGYKAQNISKRMTYQAATHPNRFQCIPRKFLTNYQISHQLKMKRRNPSYHRERNLIS